MLPLDTGGIDLGPLLPEHLSEMVAGIVLLLVIWWVVAKKVVPVFEKTYAERTEEISGGIEKAEAAQRQASEALAEYTAQLATARAEMCIRDRRTSPASLLPAPSRRPRASSGRG